MLGLHTFPLSLLKQAHFQCKAPPVLDKSVILAPPISLARMGSFLRCIKKWISHHGVFYSIEWFNLFNLGE